MEKEKRLIDANALSEKIGNMKSEITHNRGGYKYCNEYEKNEWNNLDSFDSLVCDAPTVDAVEVVRCKDCFADGCCSVQIDLDMCGDGYCSKGKRRTDNG